MNAAPSQLRPDLAVIAEQVTPGSRVLDIGCGDGALMRALRDKQCDVRGVEIDGASFVRAQHRPLAQEKVALRRHRVLRAVAFGIVGGRIDQQVDRLIALEIDDAQRLAGIDGVHPEVPRGDHFVMDYGAGKVGHMRIGGHGRQPFQRR